MHDDNGVFNPVFYHHGDALLKWKKDPGEVRRVLDIAQPRGWMGFRGWTRLLPSYWEDFLVDDDVLGSLQEELKSRGMRIMVDGGDLGRAPRHERERVQRTILTVGDPEVMASNAFCNEGNENGGGLSPREMADWLQPIAEKWPSMPKWCTTGGAGHEHTNKGIEEARRRGASANTIREMEHQNMDRWCPRPSNMTGKHGTRDGSVVDKVRHEFSFAYEGEPEKEPLVDDEPFSPGRWASVSQNKDQLTPAAMSLGMMMGAIAGTWFVFFPGIERDGQPITDFLGYFDQMPRDIARLPANLFEYDDLEHGGSSQGKRVWEVTDGDGKQTARCDHALKGNELYVAACYDEGMANPPRQNFRQRKGTETDRILCAPWGHVSIGRQ